MNTIVLTGISRGLGKALHDLLCSDFPEDKKIFISRGFSDINKSGLIDYLDMDLSDKKIQCDSVDISNESNNVIFVNNASVIEPIRKVLDVSFNEVEKAMDVNFWAPLQLARYLAAESKRIKADFYIVNISTGAAVRPIQGWLAYCVSKTAIKMAIDVLVEENKHIQVVHFDPGVMDTGMQTVIRSSAEDDMCDVETFKEFKTNNKLRDPSEVATEIISIIKELEQ